MQNVVELPGYVYEFRNVVVVKFKIGQGEQMLDVFEAPGNEVVHANDMIAILDKALAKVRTQKAGRAGD